jgi:hypothetical protein
LLENDLQLEGGAPSPDLMVGASAPQDGEDTMTQALILARSLLGEGFRLTLEQMTDWQAQLTSTQNPVVIAELTQHFQPDVTILDDTVGTVLELFERPGKDCVRNLGMTMVVTAAFQSEELLFQFAKWGVSAYLTAGIPLEAFVTAVERVSAGEWLLSSEGLRLAPPPRGPFPSPTAKGKGAHRGHLCLTAFRSRGSYSHAHCTG